MRSRVARQPYFVSELEEQAARWVGRGNNMAARVVFKYFIVVNEWSVLRKTVTSLLPSMFSNVREIRSILLLFLFYVTNFTKGSYI
jgi:hypothetical protein